MTATLRKLHLKFWIRRSVRYLLVSNGFRLLQVVVVLGALTFLLTGERIRLLDSFGNRADIVASIFATVSITFLLTHLNRRVMNSIDRRFFREAYDAQQILSELVRSIPNMTSSNQVFELAASKIEESLHPGNVTIFIEDEHREAYMPAFSLSEGVSTASAGGKYLRLSYDDPIIRNLRTSGDLNPIDLVGDQTKRKLVSPVEHEIFSTFKAALLIPISSNRKLMGLLVLGSRMSDLPYSVEDRSLLLVVANQIAAFLKNMEIVERLAEERRAAQELELASEVQRHLFPLDGLQNGSLEIFGTCLPARGIGGDYYDYFELDRERTGVAIADVAGKGIAAALLMSTVQASLRCQLNSSKKPLVDVVSSMNKMLRRSTGNSDYATFFFAEYDAPLHALTYVNAGHNPPLLMRNRVPLNGNAASVSIVRAGVNGGPYQTKPVGEPTRPGPVVKRLAVGGPVIGTFLDLPYEQETLVLNSGDTLVIYTDGVTEALDPWGMEFGEDNLRLATFESLALSAEGMVDRIIARVRNWQSNAPQHDDITLIVMKVK